MNSTDRSERFWQKTMLVINNIWEIVTETRCLNFNFIDIPSKEGKIFVLKCNFQFFYKQKFVCYCIVFIWFYLLSATSHVLVFFCNSILYTHFKDFSVFLIIYSFMANFQSSFSLNFQGEMTAIISSYVTCCCAKRVCCAL